MSFLSVSDRAWEIIEEVGYVGYDALLPFRTAVKNAYFPYTPYWQGTAQLNKACELILEEGLMVGSRDSIVDERIKQIEKFVSERKLKEAESLLADLETNTDPSQPALIKIHSIINRLQSRLR